MLNKELPQWAALFVLGHFLPKKLLIKALNKEKLKALK
jgi:hypothetical protein